jgi:uncharacterized C2H2 Zn-finger protein
MVKQCARCNGNWQAADGDPFLTCPACRIPAPKKRKQGGSKVGKEFGAGKHRGEDSPWGENAVRHLEDR